MITTCALDGDVVGVQELDDARRRAGQRAGRAHDQAAEVHRVQPVDVLGRVDGQQGLLLVEAGGQRQLHQEGADGRVGVEAGDDASSSSWVRVGRQVLVGRVDAHLRAVRVLHGHVAGARAVVADEDGAEARP